MKATILGCMYAGLILRLAALFFMGRERLLTRYVCWALYLSLGSIRTGILLYYWHTNQRMYNTFHIASQDAMLLLRTAVVIEGLWLIARHYRNIAVFFTGALGFFSVLATWAASEAFAWLIAPGQWQMQILRAHSLTVLLAMLLAWGFYQQIYRLPVRRNAQLHCLILYGVFSLLTLGSGLIAAKVSVSVTGIGMIVLVLGDIMAGLAWALWIRRSGEVYISPPDARRKLDEILG